MIRASSAAACRDTALGELARERVGLALEERRERLPGEVPLVEQEERLSPRLPAADGARASLMPGAATGRCASISSR